MSDYLERKKKEREEREALRKNDSTNAGRKTAAGMGNNNINGETLSEWRARQKTGVKYTQNNDSGIRNVYGQTPEEYRKMISSGQSLSDYDKWKGTSEQLLREYDKYSHSGKYQSKESYQSYAKRIETQLKNTVKLKEKNEDKVSEIDDIIQRLSEASGDNDEGYKYFGESENWGDEESFNEYQNALKAAEVEAEANKKAATRKKDEKNAKQIAAKEVRYSVPENTPGSRSYQSTQSAKDKEAAQEEVEKNAKQIAAKEVRYSVPENTPGSRSYQSTQSAKDKAAAQKEVEKINEFGNLWQYGVDGLNPTGSQAAANYSRDHKNVTDGQRATVTKAVNDKRYSDQLNKYEQEQQEIAEKAAQAASNPDFEEKSQYKKSGWTWNGIIPSTEDFDYEYINNHDGNYREMLNHGDGNYVDEYGSEQARKGYDYITNDEVKVYNYLYETEGRKQALNYLESLELTKRMTEKTTQKASEYADEHPWIASATTVLSNAIHAGQGYLGDLLDKAQGKPVDVNSYANLSMNESNAIRNTVTEGIGNPVGQFMYQTGMSMADFVAAAAISAPIAAKGLNPTTVSGFIMGSNAATQGVIEAKERGLSDDKALLTGLAQGVAEEVFEKYSLENLKVMATTNPKTLKNVFVNVAKQAFTEGSEEFFTDMANAFTDLVINGDEAENMQKRQTYMDAGYSEAEADKMVALDFVKQLGLSFAGGAVSGGIMGGVTSGFAYNYNKTNDAGTEVNPETEEKLKNNPEESYEELEKVPGEETTMDPEEYFGETVENGTDTTENRTDTTENRTEKSEVAPAQPKKRKRQLEKAKKKAGMQQIVKTVLENGKVNDTVANEITKNEDLKAAFEEETGLKLSGSEEQQANAVKEIVRVKAEEAQKPPEIPEFLRIENVKKRRLNSSAETTTTTVQENKTPTGKIIGVEFDKDMSAKFKDDGGKTYTYNEAISKNPEMGDAYITAYRVAIENGTTAAKVFLENYSTNYPMSDYYGGFRMMYNAGRNGIPFEVSVKAASYVKDTIGQTVMKKAWDLGMNAKQAEDSKVAVQSKKQKRKGTGTYKNQTVERSGGLPELERLVANRTGIDITRKSGLDHNANGSFTASTMTMLLNENAQNEYTALIHELGEFGLAYDRTEMKEVQQMLVKYWTEKNGITGLREIDSMVEEYQRRYKAVEGSKTRAEAMDEIVNDALGGLFSTDEGIKEFTDWLKTDSGYTKGEQRTIVQRFVDALDSIVKYLKEKIKDMSLSKAARKALELERQQVEDVRKQFLNVLDVAIEKANTTGEYQSEANSGEKYSLDVDVDDELAYFGVEDKLNDYVGVQKAVINKLNEENYFGDYVNENTGMVITLGRKGIKETLSSGKRFQTLAKDIKKLKVATIRSLPNLLQKAVMTVNDAKNIHGESTLFSYFETDIDINGKTYKATFDVKKSSAKNHFYIHYIRIEKESSVLLTPAQRQEINETKNSLQDGIITDNPENASTKFSLEETGKDSTGKSLSNEQKSYFAESKVRDEKGNLKVMYHGSQEQFTVFDRKKAKSSGHYGRGFYFSDSASHAGQYGQQYEVYLNVKNPVQTGTNNITMEQLEAFVAELAKNEDYGIENYGYDATVESVAEDVFGKDDFDMLMDLDTTCVGDMVETIKLFNEVNGTDYDGIIAPTETVAFYPNQIKKTDNITPTVDEDIRYSLPEEYDRVKLENETLLRENETFKQIIDSLEHTLDIKEGIKLNEQSIEKAAKNMLRKYKSNVDRKSFVENVTALFQAAAKNEMSVSDFEYLAESIVRPLIEQSENNLQISDYAKDVLSDIKKTAIKLDGMQKKESAYHYGSYGNLRKSLFGRANFSENGTQLDTLWQQWAESYPDLFDADISPVDQPIKLAEIIKSLKEDYANEYGFDIDDAVSYAAAELLNEYASIPEVENLLDAQKKSEFRVRYRELTNMIKKDYQQRYEGQIKELKQKNAERISKMSAENRDRLLRQEAKYRSRMAETRTARLERQEKAKYKDSIVKGTKSVLNMLEKNSDKYHVPEVLKEPTVTFLKTLDFTSETGGNQTTRQLQNRLSIIAKDFTIAENGDSGMFMQDLDPDFVPKLNEMIACFASKDEVKKISEMNATELKDVAYLINTLKRTITMTNELIGNRRYQEVADLGNETIGEFRGKKTKKKGGKVEGMADNLLNIEMLDSRSFFEELGEGAESIFQELRGGFNKRTWLIEDAQEYMGEVLGDQNIKHWTGEKAGVTEFRCGGTTFELTTGQLMNLYILSKRPQAQLHLFDEKGYATQNGGFTIDEKSTVKRQKTPDRAVRISKKEMQQMFEKLTPEQKRIADQMQKYLAKNCADWGNETSMTLYGYKKFGDKFYWPIKTNENTRDTMDSNVGDNTSLYAVRNWGATKNVDKNANNPLIIGDIFDTFAEHVTGMANYNAFCIPISDAMKWYNFRSRTEDGVLMGTVKEEMERALGKGAKDYFVRLIKDVNGESKKGTSSEISDTFTSKYKAAAVGGNLRVVIQQPTAYMRALAEIDAGYLTRAMLQKPAVKEMQENSAIALWKSWGYFETGLGQSMKRVITGEGSFMENLVEKSMWAAGVADDVTWGTLWNAVKLEVADRNKGIDTSSEYFMKLVSERFDDVIDKTQVVDTVLHRSQIMRSKDGAVKMATAFMAEPTKTYNLLRNAMLYGDTKTKVRTVAACTATAVVTAAVASVADAFRDDDEEKAWGEKWVENFKANTIDGINPLNNIPYVKEITSFMDGYDSERMDMAGVSSLITGIQQAYKYAKGDSKKTLYGVLKSLARGVSQVSGVPAYNVLRELETLANQFVDIDTNKPTGSTVRIRLLNAMKNNNETQIKKWLEWYDEEYQKKIDAGKTSKEAMSAMKSSIANQYKEIYQKSTTADKIKIKQLLLRIRVGNKQLFNGYDWSDWDKTEKKTEEDD